MSPNVLLPAGLVVLSFLLLVPASAQIADQKPSGIPQAIEICDNQIDDDGDGYVDCYDSDCQCFTGEDCSVTDLPSTFRARLAWQSGNDGASVTAIPVVANMNPQQDSLPEIIVAEASAANGTPNHILFFRGDGSNLNNPFVLTIPSGFDSYPVPGPTIGDIDNDGIPELIMACRDRIIRVFRNYSETAGSPMSLWISSSGILDYVDQKPYLADFDGDGIPEIYAGSDVFKFDFSTPGTPALYKVINGFNYIGRAIYNSYLEGSCSPTAVDILSVADCNGDPDCAGLELVAGPLIYSIDLDPNDGDGYQIKIQRDLNQLSPGKSFNDGYTAVADVDLDGVLDVVVSSVWGNNQLGVYVWNKNGFLKSMLYPTGSYRSGSLACIANLYDDRTAGFAVDMPEILVCNAYNLNCFNLQAAQLNPAKPYWWSLVTKDYSGFTGSTVYDFNGDGIFEIVYRDEDNLRILYGGPAPFPPGVDAERNWFKMACGSLTSDEYPIVADVDNDGETEIAVTGYTFSGYKTPSSDYRGRLRVFESDADPWVPCRNVWNQFNYFVVNVNDDLSIPAHQQLHQLEFPNPGSGNRPLNRYLSQRPLLNDKFEPFLPVADAMAGTKTVQCVSDSMEVSLNICNLGSKGLKQGTPVAFYASDPTTTDAVLLGTGWLNTDLKVDSCGTFAFMIPAFTGTVFGIVNDDGSHPRPLNLAADFPVTDQPECNWLNNIFQFDFHPASLPLDIGPDVHTCSDTVLVLRAGSSHATYRWQDGSADSVFQAKNPGVYWVEVSDQCVGKQTDSLVVEVFGSPQVQIDTVNGDCAGHPGVANVTVGSGFPPFDYRWTTGDTIAWLTDVPDGLYAVTVTDANGCTATGSTWIEAGGLVQVDFTITPVPCFGQTGAINLNVSKGKAPLTYQWSNMADAAVLQNAPAGNYSVTVTDADACSQVLGIQLPQPAPLLSAGISPAPACPGLANGSLQFLGAAQGTPPYNLLWSTGNNTQQIAGLAANTYTITLTDANGCSLVEQAQVPEFALPVLDTAVTPVACFGQSNGQIAVTPLSGAPAYGYTWSNGAAGPSVPGLAAGNYALTFTYADGKCAQTLDFAITQPPALVLEAATQDPACAGGLDGRIDLSAGGGTPPLSFQWSEGSATEELTVPAGVYTVTATDANGCSEILPLELTEPAPLLSAGVTTQGACPGLPSGSAAFLGAAQGTPPYSLHWSTADTTTALNGLPAGNYSLTITDAHGCTLVENAAVPVFQPPALASTVQPVACFGQQNGEVAVSVSGGTPAFGYSWSTGAATPAIQGLGPGTYFLTLTYADGKCSEPFEFEITEPPALALTQPVLSPVGCFGDSTGSIQILPQGGVAPYDFKWSDGQTTSDIYHLSAGAYTLTVTDAQGCTLAAPFSVEEPENLTLQASVTPDSCQTSNGTIVLTLAGGTQPYGLTWSNGANLTALSNLSAGIYALTLTDANGCQQQLLATVPVHGKIPFATPYTDTITCAEPLARIGVSVDQSNITYTWNGPTGALPDKAEQIVLQAGTYSVLATNPFGCATTVQIVVPADVEAPESVVAASQIEVPCNQTAAWLDASGSSSGFPYENRWSLEQNGLIVFDTAAVTLAVNSPGWYVHTVRNLRNGCQASDSVWVHWADPIIAALTVDSISCFGENDGYIRLKALSGGTPPLVYSIDNQHFTANGAFANLPPGSYPVSVRDAFGCLWESVVRLSEPDSIGVRLVASDSTLELGQSLRLEAKPWPPGLALSSIIWQPAADFGFTPMALTQQVRPLDNTTFSVQIFDERGCPAMDRTFVRVDNYQIYVPNVIYPGTANNSFFTIFAGDGVVEISTLRVFDRWGNWVFEKRHFPANDPYLGWDGAFRGEAVNPGVFVWYAEIQLRDGRTRLLKGDVTVVR